MSSTVKPSTICWECANAIGNCSWSTDFIPVKGWKAEQTTINTNTDGNYLSYCVYECPEFKQDAIRNRLKRYKENNNDTVSKNP